MVAQGMPQLNVPGPTAAGFLILIAKNVKDLSQVLARREKGDEWCWESLPS